MFKPPHNALISHTSKVMLKILQVRLQQYMNCELPDVQAGFRKGRGIRDQIANIHWIIEKLREFQKNIYFCLIDYAKAFDYVNHNELWQILQETGQVGWYSHFFQIFPQFIVMHTVKGFGIVNKAEIDVFLELVCFFHDPEDVGNLISGFSAFFKTSLNIWKFMVHVLLKPGLENFEHDFTSM